MCFAQSLLFSLTKGPFHLYAGHTPRTLHPATATHTEPAAKNQAEAVWLLGVWEDHSGGISQVWAAEELLPKTPAPALLHQLYPVPTLTPGLQAGRYACTPPALVSPLGASKVKAGRKGGFVLSIWPEADRLLPPWWLHGVGPLALGPVSTSLLAASTPCPHASKERGSLNSQSTVTDMQNSTTVSYSAQGLCP